MPKPHYNILIVDDSSDDRASCKRYLQRDPDRNYTVWEEELSRKGLVAAQVVKPDCILLDYRFPDIDGLQFLSQLRVLTGELMPAVVMLTGSDREGIAIEAMKQGAQDYLVKDTLTQESLWRAVANAIEKVGLRHALTVQHHQLHASEARFRALVNSVPAMVWAAAPDGTMTFVTDQWLTFCGMTAEQLARDWIRLVVHPEDRERCAKQWTEALTHGTPYEIEVRNRRYDGEYRWFLTRAVPAQDDNGRIIGWYGTTTDIHEHKHTEEESLRLAAIVESSDDAIISKSLDGVVTSWNAAAEWLFGYRAEEMIGQPIFRLIPEDRQDEELRMLEHLRRGERIKHLETVCRKKDGRLVNVSLTSSPLRNEHGEIIGSSKILRDITARTQAEEERAQLLAEFQQFSYVVSHDLNEPLRTITNFITLLARRHQGTLGTESEEYIDFIVDGARRMQQMLTDLLAYTRVGHAPQMQAVDCEALLAQVLSDLELTITDQHAIVTHDPLPTVQGDPTRLRQVLQNLIGNALKFHRPQTAPHVHVSAQQEGSHWQFVVRDNGIGINPTQVGRLFQVFQRLHTRSEYEGSGIGLAICKRIVEQHGGRIWVESEPGEGSIFYFTLHEKSSQEIVKR